MRVAVLSDIHGFSLALETVLADIADRGPFDAIVVAGDLGEGGPDPDGVLDLVRAGELVVVQGNTDRDLVLAHQGLVAGPALDFALDRIGDEGVAWLASLPLLHRITPPGGTCPGDDLLVCHANPHNLEDKLTPEMGDDELRAVIGDVAAGAIAFGHHHVAFVRDLDGTLLADVSAVGNPKDGDLRAKYGILAWDVTHRRWEAEIRRLPYPLEATVEQMRDSGMPEPDKAIRKLMRASYRR